MQIRITRISKKLIVELAYVTVFVVPSRRHTVEPEGGGKGETAERKFANRWRIQTEPELEETVTEAVSPEPLPP